MKGFVSCGYESRTKIDNRLLERDLEESISFGRENGTNEEFEIGGPSIDDFLFFCVEFISVLFHVRTKFIS